MNPIELKPSPNPRVPDAACPFRHSLPLQTRFSDFDMLGHLNNNVYLTFMDLAKARYFLQLIPDCMKMNGTGVVVVNINCDFFAPTLFDEPIEALTTVTSIGQKSLTLEQRIINPENGETKCIGRTVMAGFDPKTMHSADIRQEWVEAIEKFEERTIATPQA